MRDTIKIRSKVIGPGNPCFLIAEIAQSHDGSLGTAHAYIDAAAVAGADAVKFQTHIAAAESTVDEEFRVKFSLQDSTRYDYWKRMEFTESQWEGLAAHADERGLIFLSSPFSLEAVHLLARIGVPAWKVGSGETRSEELIKAMIESSAPLLISTGLSTLSEIDQVVKNLRLKDKDFVLLQCTSSYPTALERVGLNLLKQFRDRYNCPIGLSDHSGSPFPAIAAIARDCDIVELHVTFDRRLFGPDVLSSVTFEEFSMIRAARDAIFLMDKNPVNKDELSEDLKELRNIFGKSFALKHPLPAGTIISQDHLTLKKPANGIPSSDLRKIIGRRLTLNVEADRLLKWEDLE